MRKYRALLQIAIILSASHVLAAEPQRFDRVGFYNLSSQRLSGDELVVVEGRSSFASVSVVVTVSTDGHVIDAEVASNFGKVDPQPALVAARKWIFRPQTFEGHPVQAVGTVSIGYLMPEIPADATVPFPDASAGDVEIRLDRSSCFGSCPDYSVSVNGSGRVRFSAEGSNFPGAAPEPLRTLGPRVLWPGTHDASAAPQAVADLVRKFRDAHFMGLKSTYAADITDNATYSLTLRVGRTSKQVVDYVGRSVGMPASVTALEDAVDTLAGTDRWVYGTAGTVPLLVQQGFRFNSKAGANLAVSVIAAGRWPPDSSRASEFIMAAVAAGLDLNISASLAEPHQPPDNQPLGALIAAYAAETGDEVLFDEVTRRGYLSRMSKRARDDAFTSGAGCSPKIVKALIAAGADPKAQGYDGNPLNAVRSGHGRCENVAIERRVEMTRVSIALGALLESRDDLGWTPLMGCDYPEVAELLLKAGADPNAHDKDGTTPLLSSDDDRVAILLLRAGADPRARDNDGTVRDQARTHHWPATLAWLDAHGIP